MNKPVLAIDFDDVIYPFSSEFLKYANSKLGVNKTLDDMVTYRLDTVYGVSYDKIVELIEDFMADVRVAEFEPIKGSVEALTKLKDEFSLHIVTARLDKYDEQTQLWLNKFFPGIFSGVHYCNFYALSPENASKITKLSKCKEIKAICLIDDNVYNVLNVIKGGVDAVLFGDYAWHQELSEQSEYWALRVRGWEEFMDCYYFFLGDSLL